ncbi:MAG: TlpA family protein disulfide reductase [Blastocatellia bacterium]|nr:TlpA family protein disulfide reductase [Blastocatellia bacterium]
MRFLMYVVFLLGLGLLPVSSVAAQSKTNPAVLLGKPAQPWQVSTWVNSKPLTLSGLKGKVVLVRWWTSGCPFCENTAPALNEFATRYQPQGLQVVGLYHHKAETPLTVGHVKRTARKLGFTFPIGIDNDWKNLRSWWLDPLPEADFTSVTFLIDRQGVIRFIHPGGQYVKGEAAYDEMGRQIETLLRQK